MLDSFFFKIQRDQLNEHERRISEIDLHLESHRANAPPLSAKGRLKEEYADVEIFLQAEASGKLKFSFTSLFRAHVQRKILKICNFMLKHKQA